MCVEWMSMENRDGVIGSDFESLNVLSYNFNKISFSKPNLHGLSIKFYACMWIIVK